METNTGLSHWYCRDSAGNNQYAQAGDPTYDEVTSLRVDSNWTCHLYFLPMPWQCVNGTWQTNDCSTWETSGNFYTDWDRSQPSDLTDNSDPLNPKEVRSLYWVRVYADQAYTTAPHSKAIGPYCPNYGEWVAASSDMSDAIKDADPEAKVFVPGTGHPNNYLAYYLSQNTFWDGLVVHPYVYPDNYNQSLLTMVNNADHGLLKQINEMRTWLIDNSLSGKQIACTEWGYYQSASVCASLAAGLYCVDGTLSIMNDYDGVHGIVVL